MTYSKITCKAIQVIYHLLELRLQWWATVNSRARLLSLKLIMIFWISLLNIYKKNLIWKVIPSESKIRKWLNWDNLCLIYNVRIKKWKINNNCKSLMKGIRKIMNLNKQRLFLPANNNNRLIMFSKNQLMLLILRILILLRLNLNLKIDYKKRNLN